MLLEATHAAAGTNVTTILDILVASGFFTAIAETFRWWRGRGKERVDNAQIVQGMAIDLVGPLHAELTDVRKRLALLSDELDAVLGYAILAHALLESPPIRQAVIDSGHRLPVPPVSVLKR